MVQSIQIVEPIRVIIQVMETLLTSMPTDKKDMFQGRCDTQAGEAVDIKILTYIKKDAQTGRLFFNYTIYRSCSIGV